MTRRIGIAATFVALAGLLLAGALTAQQPAPTVLVIEEVPQSGAAISRLEMQRMTLLGVLQKRGVVYTLVSHRAVTTADAAAGRLVTSRGVIQHKLVIHLWYDTDQSPANAAVYDPRTYLRASGWPSVPHVWYFSPTGSSYNNTGTDTTGVNDFYVSGQALVGSLYAVGRPWTWKSLYGLPKPAVATATRAAGLWRPLVAYGVTAASSGAFASGIRPAVVNADSLINRSNNPDSVMAWARAKSGGAADLAASQVFIAAQAQDVQDLPTLLCGLAYADSVSSITTPGGGLFANPYRTTRDYGLVFTAANRRGSPSAMNETRGGGTYCPSGSPGVDTCDVNYVSQGVDSMNTLKDLDGNPVAFTWAVETDSLATAYGQIIMPILKKATSASFAMSNIAGAVSGANTTTAASTPTTSRDPMGNVAVRTLFPTVVSFTSPDCVTDTGSVQCRVKVGLDNLEAAVPGRVDRTMIAEEFDNLPSSWTGASAGAVAISGTTPYFVPNLLGGEDSLRAALRSAGLRAYTFNPTYAGHNPGLGWATLTGALTYNTNPSVMTPREAMLPVRWGGAVVGQIAQLGVRFEPTQVGWRWITESHAGLSEEWRFGLEIGKYYIVDAGAYYHHTFNVSTRVFAWPVNGLGGPRGNPWPQRAGWWQVKWIVHGYNAAESFLPRWSNGTRKVLARSTKLENIRLTR